MNSFMTFLKSLFSSAKPQLQQAGKDALAAATPALKEAAAAAAPAIQQAAKDAIAKK